jgi:hypothetical protein
MLRVAYWAMWVRLDMCIAHARCCTVLCYACQHYCCLHQGPVYSASTTPAWEPASRQHHPEHGTATGWPYCVPPCCCLPSQRDHQQCCHRSRHCPGPGAGAGHCSGAGCCVIITPHWCDGGHHAGAPAAGSCLGCSCGGGTVARRGSSHQQGGLQLPPQLWAVLRFREAVAAGCQHGRGMDLAEGGCGVAWSLMSVKDIVCVPVLTCSVPEQALPQRPV